MTDKFMDGSQTFKVGWFRCGNILAFIGGSSKTPSRIRKELI